MSQRNSGYQRKPNDFYETPTWVVDVLIPHIPKNVKNIWEPSAGQEAISNRLRFHGLNVFSSDLSSTNPNVENHDFLDPKYVPPSPFEGIITNPPYGKAAQQFIERAVDITPHFVAMLLRTDYDHAKTRKHLFANCYPFAKKLVLTKRIVWFEPEPGQKGKSPSFNHAWFIWDYYKDGEHPIISYC